jgi:hypothetical protein
MMNDRSGADSGYPLNPEPNSGFRPIVLKNSVLIVNEKILAPQANLINIDTWGYRFLSKAYCEATDAGRNTKRIEYPK